MNQNEVVLWKRDGTMSITLIATCENRVLHLPRSLNLSERSKVRVQIESLPEKQAQPTGHILQQLLTLADERAQLELVPFSEKERTRRLRIVHQLRGIWSKDDEVAFEQTRKELWSQWQPRSFV